MDQANADGYSAFVDIERLGATLGDGLLYVNIWMPSWIYSNILHFHNQ